MPHAVSLLRATRLASSVKPFLARGGFKRERCEGCRLVPSHCMCTLRTPVDTRAAVCLLMADIEPMKPTNTGWLIADLVADTFAFRWARTETDPALLALLSDPRWDCYVVFPGEYTAPERVVYDLRPSAPVQDGTAKRPLFILLDGTWAEARKMFSRSPYLNHMPVLSLAPAAASQYRLRRSWCGEHLCTSEVAARCLGLAGDEMAEQVLGAYLGVFTHNYLRAKNQLAVDAGSAEHQQWREVMARQVARTA